jgi:hypothetical protein
MNAKLLKLDEVLENSTVISKDCKIDFSRVKAQGILTHNFDQKPIGKFGDIKLIGDEYFVEAIVPINSEGEKLINAGFESGMLRVYPGGEVKYNENNEISEFKIYEVSICAKK